MRSLSERIVHTALFEILAIAIAAPAISALTAAPLVDSGALSLLVSIGAVAANYLWTLVLDRFVPTRRRGVAIRVVQAAGLEVLLMAYTIPLVIHFTGLPFWRAVLLDVSGVGFFVLFGMAYNAAFDAVMLRFSPEPEAGFGRRTPDPS